MAARTLTLVANCLRCSREMKVAVAPDDYRAWRLGAYAQDAFPYLSPADREALISQCCEPCFDAMFGGPADEDEPLPTDGDVQDRLIDDAIADYRGF